MSELLRIYLPPWHRTPECDAAGEPLDWLRCRTCEGTGVVVGVVGIHGDEGRKCKTCCGHGSLKAAALAEKARQLILTKYDDPQRNTLELRPPETIRCEGCSHPMSEGTWEDPNTFVGGSLGYVETRRRGEDRIVRGIEPQGGGHGWDDGSVHFSRCDERCKHGHEHDRMLDAAKCLGSVWQASWRGVDVRCLSWAHDLRPEQLAVLCTRCWAERTR